MTPGADQVGLSFWQHDHDRIEGLLLPWQDHVLVGDFALSEHDRARLGVSGRSEVSGHIGVQ